MQAIASVDMMIMCKGCTLKRKYKGKLVEFGGTLLVTAKLLSLATHAWPYYIKPCQSVSVHNGLFASF